MAPTPHSGPTAGTFMDPKARVLPPAAVALESREALEQAQEAPAVAQAAQGAPELVLVLQEGSQEGLYARGAGGGGRARRAGAWSYPDRRKNIGTIG
jgi:hypothetical protein